MTLSYITYLLGCGNRPLRQAKKSGEFVYNFRNVPIFENIDIFNFCSVYQVEVVYGVKLSFLSDGKFIFENKECLGCGYRPLRQAKKSGEFVYNFRNVPILDFEYIV